MLSRFKIKNQASIIRVNVSSEAKELIFNHHLISYDHDLYRGSSRAVDQVPGLWRVKLLSSGQAQRGSGTILVLICLQQQGEFWEGRYVKRQFKIRVKQV